MSNEDVKVVRNGRILEVTLDRPKANAIDATTSRLMGEIFAEFRDDKSLGVAIITGAGPKFFCPGWDLKGAAEGEEPDADFGVGGFGGLQELPNLNKPVIAAVNGICCGGGFELALSADLIIAADHARFALPEIKVGTLADAASIKLARRIPHHVAMDLLLTGRWMDVQEAERWGLIRDIVPGDELMDKAREVATLLAEGPPLVFAAIKELMRETENMSVEEAFAALHGEKVEAVQTLYNSEDNKEGPIAFAENRAPVWKGC